MQEKLPTMFCTIGICINKRIDDTSQPQNANSLLKLVDEEQIPSLTSHIVSECVRQSGLISKEKELAENERWLSSDDLRELIDCWVTTTSKAFRAKSFLNATDKTHIFFMMRNLAKNELPELVAPLLIDNADLDAFVQVFIGYGQDSIKGSYIHIEEEWLASIGDTSRIRSRIKERIENGVDDPALQAIYQCMLTGKDYYTADGSERKEW